MIKNLLSPTEKGLSGLMRADSITSPIPEEKGADILAYTKQGLVGIQRKEVPHDFLSSITDGRLTRETALLVKHCKFPILVCEGRFRFYPNGQLALDKREPSRFTRAQIRGMLFDIKYVKGISIDWTDDIGDTVFYIRTIVDFMSREKHLGLYNRPSAKGTWNVPTARDIDLWILQSFPGIGPAIADNIMDYFDGDIPLRWTCALEQLKSVQGLSKKRAEVMYEMLHGHIPKVASSSRLDDLRARLSGAGKSEQE